MEGLGGSSFAMIKNRVRIFAYTGTAFSLSGGLEVSLEEPFLEFFLNS